MSCSTFTKCEPCISHKCIYGIYLNSTEECVKHIGDFSGDRLYQYIDGCDDVDHQIPPSYKALAISGWVLAGLFCLALVTCLILCNFGIRRIDGWIETVLQNEREAFANSQPPQDSTVRQRRKSMDRSESQPPMPGTSTEPRLSIVAPPSPSKEKIVPTFEVFARPRFNFTRASSCPPSIEVSMPLHTTVQFSPTIYEEEEETEFNRKVKTVAIITTAEANGEELEDQASHAKPIRKPWARRPAPEESPALTRLQAVRTGRRLHQC